MELNARLVSQCRADQARCADRQTRGHLLEGSPPGRMDFETEIRVIQFHG